MGLVNDTFGRRHGTGRQFVTGLLGVLILGLACQSVGGPPTDPSEPPPDPLPAPGPALVSNPTPGVAQAALQDGTTHDLVFVSLPPGSVPNGETATIENLRTKASFWTVVTDGGFDPIPVGGAAGDTLLVAITVPGTEAPVRFGLIVPITRRPVVVRTDPPPRRRDVPLNAMLLVVFSEPVDPGSLDEAIQLFAGDGPAVPGTIVLLPGTGVMVEFQPEKPLAPGTEYRLVVGASVRDLDGDALGADHVTDFVTEATTESALMIEKATDGSGDLQVDTVLATLGAPLRVLVTRAGAPQAGVEVQWSTPGLSDDLVLSAGSTITDPTGMTGVSVTLGPRAGGKTVEAAIAGNPDATVRFGFEARPGEPTIIAEHYGDGDLGLVDISFRRYRGYHVKVQDSHGNWIRAGERDPNSVVEWSVISGGGTIAPTLTGGYVHRAVATPRTLGPQVVRASLPSGASVEFQSTAVSAVISVGYGLCYRGFRPAQVSVVAGSLVGWIWCDDGSGEYELHDVTFEDGVGSSSVQQWTHVRRFDTPGSYRYRCTQHSTDFETGEEVGTVVVTATAVPALAGTATGLAITGGDGQVGQKNISLTWPYTVKATDIGGGAAVGTTVVWRVISGGGTVTPVSTDGLVAVATPADDGEQVVSASIPGGPGVTFRATAVSAFVETTRGGDGHCQEGGFFLANTTVRAGESVAWIYCDPDDGENYPHVVAFEDGQSERVDWESTHFARQFMTPGIYRYRCALHSSDFENGEVGTVTVLP